MYNPKLIVKNCFCTEHLELNFITSSNGCRTAFLKKDFSIIIIFLTYCFCDAGNGTQVLAHLRQDLCSSAMTPGPVTHSLRVSNSLLYLTVSSYILFGNIV